MTVSLSKSLVCGTAMALALPAAVLADVSSEQVWDNWKSYAETFGQTVNVGSQDMNGGTLTLNDVSFSMEFPEGAITSTLAMLELKERGDGTVAITMSPEMPLALKTNAEAEEAVDLNVVMRQSGTSIIASGEAGNITYDYLAAELGISVSKLIVDGVDAGAVVDLTMTDIDGKYSSVDGDVNMYASQLAAAGAGFNVEFTDPEEGANVVIKGTIANLASSSIVEIPADFDIEDPTQIFSGAFNVKGSFSTGQTAYQMALTESSDSFDLSSTSGSSSLDFAMADGSISYGGSATDLNYILKSPQIPFPEVTIAMAETAFNILMPMAQSDKPQDFGFLVKIGGLEISDMIWSMLDAGNALPHDPATLIIDLAGKANWLIDITNEEETKAFGDKMPGELHELTVNNLTLALLGAEITGGGEFTFDNSDLETFDGMPAPTGSIKLNIVGINGLMDKLAAMGLLPQDQAMGARMMLGLFARPGDGEDTMTSTLEVKGDGSVFANGQQLK